MRIYSIYNIKETDQFNPSDFPKVEEEILTICRLTSTHQKEITASIIIDYLKNQFLKEEWRETNPELMEIIAGTHSGIHHLQSLFDSCRHNVNFTREYEAFILKNLMHESVPAVIDQDR